MQSASETDAFHRVVYLCITKVVFSETISLGVQLLGGYHFIESAFVRVFLFLFSISDL
jgi:hypothetical protein